MGFADTGFSLCGSGAVSPVSLSHSLAISVWRTHDVNLWQARSARWAEGGSRATPTPPYQDCDPALRVRGGGGADTGGSMGSHGPMGQCPIHSLLEETLGAGWALDPSTWPTRPPARPARPPCQPTQPTPARLPGPPPVGPMIAPSEIHGAPMGFMAGGLACRGRPTPAVSSQAIWPTSSINPNWILMWIDPVWNLTSQ